MRSVALTDCITAIHGDNVEYMKTLPDGFFDVLILDPPYGINAPNMQMGTHKTRKEGGYPGVSVAQKLKGKGRLNSGSGKLKDRFLNKSTIDWDYEVPTQEYWNQVFRVSKHQAIFGGNYFELPPTRGVGCWNKKQPWDNFSQWEMIWTSFDIPAFMIEYSNKGGANSEEKIHPTQKPVYVYRALLKVIKKKLKESFKVGDMGHGSGAIFEACDIEGIEIIGVEKSDDYFQPSIDRFNSYLKNKTIDVFKQGEELINMELFDA